MLYRFKNLLAQFVVARSQLKKLIVQFAVVLLVVYCAGSKPQQMDRWRWNDGWNFFDRWNFF